MAADTLMADLKERAKLEVNTKDALREVIHEFETKNEYTEEYTKYVEGMSYAESTHRFYDSPKVP